MGRLPDLFTKATEPCLPDGPRSMQQLLREFFQKLEEDYEREGASLPYGISTGFAALDIASGGLTPGTLLLLVGAPGVGKTSLLLSMARKIATEQGLGVAYFSLQTHRNELIHRLMAAQGGVPYWRLNEDLQDNDWPRLTRAAGVLAHLPLYIDDETTLTADEFGRRVRGRLRQEDPVRVVMVDHLACLVRGVPDGVGAKNAQAVVQALSRMARDLDVAVVLAGELGGWLWSSRGGRRPVISDLADLGLTGREAHRVWLQHPETPLPEDFDEPRPVRVAVHSAPFGGPALAFLRFLPAFRTFVGTEAVAALGRRVN